MIITKGYASGNGLIALGFGFIYEIKRRADKAVKKLTVSLMGQQIGLIGKDQPALIKPRRVRLLSFRREATFIGDPEVNVLSKVSSEEKGN